jgi:hypothetical protein
MSDICHRLHRHSESVGAGQARTAVMMCPVRLANQPRAKRKSILCPMIVQAPALQVANAWIVLPALVITTDAERREVLPGLCRQPRTEPGGRSASQSCACRHRHCSVMSRANTGVQGWRAFISGLALRFRFSRITFSIDAHLSSAWRFSRSRS